VVFCFGFGTGLFFVFWPLRFSVLDFVAHGNHDHVPAGRATVILTIRDMYCASVSGFCVIFQLFVLVMGLQRLVEEEDDDDYATS
jgi:hypothetical protein